MSTASTLPPLPALKSFSLTHILYDPTQPPYLSIPLTLLSLSPIFLFVSYFTLIIFTRRLTILNLAIGSVGNEVVSWGLKRVWKGSRPYAGYSSGQKKPGMPAMGHGGVGDGYGMPSSHSQAAGFLVAWGVGYALTMHRRGAQPHGQIEGSRGAVRLWRTRIYLFGLVLWSLLTAYSRYYLLYHTPYQVFAGYIIGLAIGALEFALTEAIPLWYPLSLLGRLRRFEEWVWEGIGGVGGWDLGNAPGGWGEGHLVVGEEDGKVDRKKR